MKKRSSLWQTGWRVAIGALLLVWIFHSIFIQEARNVSPRGEAAQIWESMSTWEQWAMAWREGPPQLWATLTLIPLDALILSVLLMGATIFLGVLRWRIVLRVQGIRLAPRRALGISFVAHFFNSFLLGSTGGDLMKAYYAAHETHHQKAEAVVTVLVDRLLGLWAMLLFAGLMMSVNVPLLAEHARLGWFCVLILGMLAVGSLVMVVAFQGGISRYVSGARSWLGRLPRGELLERSLDACRKFGRSPWFTSKTLGISMVLNLVCVLQIFVLSRGLGMEVPLTALLVMVPMIICLSAIPITPSGLGVRENLFVLLLAAPPLAVDSTAALSLSLLAYAGSLFWSLVGGVVYAAMGRRREWREEMADEGSLS